MSLDSFHTKESLSFHNADYHYYSLAKLAAVYPAVARLPYSLKILLENLLRREDGGLINQASIVALIAQADAHKPAAEIAFTPARVLLQDFTGVPAIVDLAAMRDAMATLGGDPNKINPLQPVELVVDHSVQVDQFGSAEAAEHNTEIEFQRNKERYGFLRWGQEAFSNFKVVPPDTGIVHQVNIEYLARVIFQDQQADGTWLYPDTLVGTDSHTTMVNGLGVLGWGVGGIEAEAAMLGQAMTMLIPEVVGVELVGNLPEGTTATDLVLTITQLLRQHGVVGKFVEFYGDGLASLPLADRATIANMAPEYGATCGYFPIDAETLRYLSLSGRTQEHIALVEAYAKIQGLFQEKGSPAAIYTDRLHVDLASIEPCIAGPKRPQDRVTLKEAKTAFHTAITAVKPDYTSKAHHSLRDGSIVIAAITSCTNTSNPAVMLGAGLLAKKACERGLKTPKWVKTSLAPGSRVVTDYLQKAGLLTYLEQLHFNLVGYGCTTCIGNSGPLAEDISKTIKEHDLSVCSILSGNRNFEGRIHPEVKMNYLASPPLVVAYALAGTMDINLLNDPLGHDQHGQPVYLRDVWPTQQEIETVITQTLKADLFQRGYADVFQGDSHWNALSVAKEQRFNWQNDSTYVKHPPYFQGMKLQPQAVEDILNARVLAKLGDSITTDHISPAGSIKADSPAGKYLLSRGITKDAFNSYGSRRGNHEIMVRGTFANVRLRNQLAPNTEGGVTLHQPSQQLLSIFDAAMRYQQEHVPCIILAGKEYGSGSSRDWAAKGPKLLGVKAVIAQSFERIHRSNLVGMGILPLVFQDGETAESLGLTGTEMYTITGLDNGQAKTVNVTAISTKASPITFKAIVRIDTPQEVAYYQHGGILPYVLRQLLKK